jgi:hypothetical protein
MSDLRTISYGTLDFYLLVMLPVSSPKLTSANNK